MANEHPNPMLMHPPYNWSLIVGYDELANTYIVDSEASKGRFTTGWDTFGNNDLSRKFQIMTIKPKPNSLDLLKVHHTVLQRALQVSQGMRPGNTTEASAHGLAAWDMWLDVIKKQKTSMRNFEYHANFLRRTRSQAKAYLNTVAPQFPKEAHAPLKTAAKHYEEVAEAMNKILALKPLDASDFPACITNVSQALTHERAALKNLEKVLHTK